MYNVVAVIHLLIIIAMVAVILLQRSEGGALGIGGGPGGIMSARGAANVLSRATGILAALFLGTSILLAVLVAASGRGGDVDSAIPEDNTVIEDLTTPRVPIESDPLPGASVPSDPGADIVPSAPVPDDVTPPTNESEEAPTPPPGQ
ncbi:MAG: preprotein translocase subunit SecG [Pseudomonadota bacterium]